MQTERLYHVVAIHEKTGTKTYCTRTPLPHNEACNVKKAFGYHPARTVQLEEVIGKLNNMKTVFISYEPIPECKGWHQWVARDKQGNQIAEANDFDVACNMAADAGYLNAVHVPNKPQLIAQAK